MSLTWKIELENWLYKRPFKIARVTLTHAMNVIVEVTDGTFIGRGECEPHESNKQITERSIAKASRFLQKHGSNLSIKNLQKLMHACPLRNGIDCALWDLYAKQTNTSVATLLSISLPEKLPIPATISLDSPDAMARETISKINSASFLKVKLGAPDDLDIERLAAVRDVAKQKVIIVDANEGWNIHKLKKYACELYKYDVALIEQPLPRGQDIDIKSINSPISLCADESVTDCNSLDTLSNGYNAINIKLDKCGGLTEALRLIEKCNALGLRYMVGSNGGTSLATAPAYLLGANACEVVEINVKCIPMPK